MGYVRNKIYRLVFEDPDMDGLEVRAKSVPLGQMLEFTKLQGQDLENLPRDRQAETMTAMLETFAGVLVDWNLEEDTPAGRVPVPATLDGLKTLDFDFVMQIIVAWMDAIMAVAAPLGRSSRFGGPSLEASIPMEPLSVSQVT